MGKLVIPDTVASAKALGWEGLLITCYRSDCAGRHTSQLPWSMIRGDDQVRLADVVGRLRCRHCERAPTGVELVKHVADNGRGAPTPYTVSLAHLIAC